MLLRVLAAAALACLAFPAFAQSDPASLDERRRGEDFEVFWRALDQGYAYFGTQRHDWRRVRELWKPRAVRARSRGEFVQALEGAIAELRDDHVSLSETSPASRRRVPAETDIWAGWREDVAVVEAVRTYGPADVAGLRPGHVIRSIGRASGATRGARPPRERCRLGERARLGAAPRARRTARRHAARGDRGSARSADLRDRAPRRHGSQRTAARSAAHRRGSQPGLHPPERHRCRIRASRPTSTERCTTSPTRAG
jgi:hypothetical protein